MKNGFYPAPEEAIAAILKHLEKPVVPERCTILDPCAGQGKALIQLADGLGLPRSNVYAVELNTGRANAIRAAYPDINLLGPCSFTGSRISARSMSLVYLNPPFDDEMGGGGREETAFLRQAAILQPPGGTLVFVLPVTQVYGKSELCGTVDTWYERLELYLFPNEHRKFNECVLIGRRRKQPLPTSELAKAANLYRRGVWSKQLDIYAGQYGVLNSLARLGEPQFDEWAQGRPSPLSRREDIHTWHLPMADKPNRFEQFGLTEEQLDELLKESPLYDVLQTNVKRQIGRPPMPLNEGHTSLLILTGLLDGYVASDPPHVVRGYCRKTKKQTRVEEYTTDAGTWVQKRTISEIPTPLVRTLWPDGKLVTYAEASTADVDIDTDAPPEEDADE